VDLVHLDPERPGERRQSALTRQRREPARQLHRAQHRRLRPVHAGALERLAQHADVEAGVVGDQHAAVEQVRDLGQHLVGWRRSVHHALCNAGEALDAARQRPLDLHERVVGLVQLPAADEDRADLGHLAEVAAVTVRLRVEGDELGGGEGCVQVQHEPAIEPRPPDG
jgi:hypothetical protein